MERGVFMVERELELIYGGGRLGLMGIIADTVINASKTQSLRLKNKYFFKGETPTPSEAGRLKTS